MHPGRRGRRAVVRALVLAATAAGALGVHAHRSSVDESDVRFVGTEAMALHLGSRDTYTAVPAPVGLRSAASCRIAGQTVVLAMGDDDSAWPGTSSTHRGYNVVGRGWVAHTEDPVTLNLVSARLAPSR